MAQPLKIRRHMVDLLFTIALFCVFAASALLVVLIGANVYKNTVRSMDANFNIQTSLTYVATKIHQNDRSGDVFVGELAGIPALVLTENINGEVYETKIYAYKGALRELFVRSGSEAGPGEGNPIIEVSSFSVADLGDGLFQFSCSADGGQPLSLTVGVQSDALAEGLVTLP